MDVDANVNACTPGFIYLVQLREHIIRSENVYKVGRTGDVMTRFKQYPNGSALLFTCQVDDQVACEAEAVSALRAEFVQRAELGREYFEGRLAAMMAVLLGLVPNRLPHLAPVPHWRHKAKVSVAPSTTCMTCEQVLAAMSRDRPDLFSARAVPLVCVLDEVRQFADALGAQCKALSAFNVGRKLENLHGCQVVKRTTGEVVVFPGFTGSVPRTPRDAPVILTAQDVDSVLSDFIATRCSVAPGLRASTTSFLTSLNPRLPNGLLLTAKQLAAVMLLKGFPKKSARIRGQPSVQCFMGIELLNDPV